MYNFNDIYYNREKYKEYVSPYIFYFFDVIQETLEIDYLDKNDSIYSILCSAAIKELEKNELINFYYIISHKVFNDHSFYLLHYFINNNKSSNEIFSELLDSDFFNFQKIVKERIIIEKKHNKKNIKNLRKYLLDNSIIINNLKHSFFNDDYLKEDIEDQGYFVDENEKFPLYDNFISIKEKINHFISIERGYVRLDKNMYFDEDEMEETKTILKHIEKIENFSLQFKKIKKEYVVKLLSIGFGFDYKKIIGEKHNFVKEKDSIIYYPSTPYYDIFPLFFNNPYSNFLDCIKSFNTHLNVGFSKEEEIAIFDFFNKIHREIYFL